MMLTPQSIMGWTWKHMSHLLVDNKDQVLLQILEGRTIILRPGSDKLIWSKSKNGQYNCKDGFRTIYKEANIIKDYSPNTICWDKFVLPKVGFFAWATFQGKVLTAKQFKLRGYEGPSMCVLCKKVEETNDHLFTTYNYRQKCWYWLMAQLGWSRAIIANLKD